MSTESARPGILAPIRWSTIHEIGAVAILVMEITLVVPWFRSLTVHTQSLTTGAAVGLLLATALIAMTLVRAAEAMGLTDGARRAALLGMLALCLPAAIRLVVYRGVPVGIANLIIDSFRSFDSVLTLVPSEVVVILAVLYAWRRGVVVGWMDVLDVRWAARRLRLGILTHIGFALIYGSSGAPRLLDVLPFYFGAGLLAVATSRADGMRRFRGAGRSPFAWDWLAGVMGAVGGTVALGLGVAAALASPPAARVAAWVGRTILDGLQIVLRVARPLILAIATLLERAVDWLLDVTNFEPTIARLQQALPRLPTPTPETAPQPSWLEAYSAPLQVILTTVLVVILALVAVRVARRNARPIAGSDEGYEGIPPQGPRFSALRGILARAEAGLGLAWRMGRRAWAAALVRRIYASLLRLAEARGTMRAPAETPREFMGRLWALFPHQRDEIEIITEEYLRVRYGEYPEAEEAVARVQAAWSVVLRQARRAAADRGEGHIS